MTPLRRWPDAGFKRRKTIYSTCRTTYRQSSTVCFHCQQAAEKYLKGFLAWHRVPFAKIHDLLELLKQVRQVTDVDVETLSARLLLLDPYSVSIRYPQEYEEEPDEQEVQEAVEAAYIVRAWVRSRLGLE